MQIITFFYKHDYKKECLDSSQPIMQNFLKLM